MFSAALWGEAEGASPLKELSCVEYFCQSCFLWSSFNTLDLLTISNPSFYFNLSNVQEKPWFLKILSMQISYSWGCFWESTWNVGPLKLFKLFCFFQRCRCDDWLMDLGRPVSSISWPNHPAWEANKKHRMLKLGQSNITGFSWIFLASREPPKYSPGYFSCSIIFSHWKFEFSWFLLPGSSFRWELSSFPKMMGKIWDKFGMGKLQFPIWKASKNIQEFASNNNLAGGFKYFLFSPLPGEMIRFDEHIFQMGWFNHQVDNETTEKSEPPVLGATQCKQCGGTGTVAWRQWVGRVG